MLWTITLQLSLCITNTNCELRASVEQAKTKLCHVLRGNDSVISVCWPFWKDKTNACNYFGQIPPEFLFVTLGTQTETGCIFNEAVSSRHCEMHTPSLSSLCCSEVVNISAYGWKSGEPSQQADFPRVSINECSQMRPDCFVDCELSEICLCMRHMPSFHYPICGCNETGIPSFPF